MYKITTFSKALLLLIFMGITELSVGQILNFTTSKATDIDVGEVIYLVNTSTGIPLNATYTWTFENCSFVIDSVLYCQYVTASTDTIAGFFTNSDEFDITITANDEEGNPIGTGYTLTFNLNPSTGCGTSCHDSLPFSCSNPNLICNPSFDFIYQNVTGQGLLQYAEPWCNLGSADQFQPGMIPSNMPSVNNMGIPTNFIGYQQPHSGTMYAGLLSLTTTHYNTGYVPSNQNEYMSIPVKTSIVNTNNIDHLIQGQRYGVSFYFSKADDCKFATDGLHAYFSSNILAPGGQYSSQWTINKSDTDPNFLHPFDNNIITNSSLWTHFYQEYIPTNNDIKYLTLGYFRNLTVNDANVHYKYQVASATSPTAYYYVDDVSLVPLPPVVTVNSPTSFCDTVELIVSGIGAGNYLWSTGATTSTISVSPATTTTYTVTVTDYYNCNPVILQSVVTVVPVLKPIIKGNQNNCDSIVFYTIENYDTNYTYTWSTQVYNQTTLQYSAGNFIFLNGNSTIITSDSAVINWNTSSFPFLPNYAVISVEAKLKGSNCSAISNLNVYECCFRSAENMLYWHDTTITQPLFLQGTNITINGTVILKSNLILNQISGGSSIFFGPYAKLIIEQGGYFEIKNGILLSACNYMWDGIYTNSINEVVRMHYTSVQNSINGIVSQNGAPLLIDTCTFSNNLRSIQIKNYRRTSAFQNPLNYSGHIRGCSFNDNMGDPLNTSDYYHLLPPYQNEPSECGIKVEKVENIQIGDASSLKNIFNRSRFAIMSYNSALSILNNEFRYINDVSNLGVFSFVQGAIFVSNVSTTFPSTTYSKDLNVGKLGNSANYFSNCHTGVFANNVKATLSNNTLDSCKVGIRLLDFTYNSRVDSNIIKQTLEGILIHKPIGGIRNIKLRENKFEYSQLLRTGISITNVNSSIGDIAQISNNTIHFIGNQNVQHYGIIVQGCNGIKVNSNNIGRGGVSLGSISNNWDKMIGIKTVQSQACQITDNYIHAMGTGIWTNGSCNLTQYSCNDLIVYKYGFYFGSLSKITEQGHLGTWNTHNKWSTPGAIMGNQKLATDATFSNLNWTGAVNWYYGPNYVFQYKPDSLGTSAIIAATPNTTNNHYCVGSTSGTGSSTGGGSPTGSGTNSGTLAILEDENITPEIRDYLFEDIMKGLDYIDLLNEFRAYDANFLYEMLASDTTIMWLGGEKDADYRHFFDSIRMSNIGDFSKVYDLIEAEDYHRADSMNNLIVPTSYIYTNLKIVLSIYLNTWSKGDYLLSETDYNTLFEIANQTPYEGGEGVYTARIMINYNPDNYGLPFKVKGDLINNSEEVSAIKLYPNPAEDILNIEFENLKGEEIDGTIKIFNISGKLLKEQAFSTHSSFYMLDINNLTNGAYVFRIQIDNKEKTTYRMQSGKLIVLKP